MSNPFTGEIRAFGFNFAPRGWAMCDGQLLAISSNDALFSLLGTVYGGDGRTTFGLPDLRGRLALQQGTGPGLSSYRLGQRGGAEQVALNSAQMPSHNHALSVTLTTHAASGNGGSADPSGGYFAAISGVSAYNDAADVTMASDMVTGSGGTIDNTGKNQGHNNIQPTQVINWCIALFGVYPSRN